MRLECSVILDAAVTKKKMKYASGFEPNHPILHQMSKVGADQKLVFVYRSLALALCDSDLQYEFGPGSGDIHELELDKDWGSWGKWEITSYIS